MTTLPHKTDLSQPARGPPSRWRVLSWQVLGLALILGVWWLVTDVLKLYPAYVFPGPRSVWTEISYGLWGTGPQDGKLLSAIGGSLRRVLTGYAAAVLLGGVAGLLMGAWLPLRATLGAYLTGLQSVPSIAFVPFAILFFGLNERAVLFVVILEGFIPVALAVSGALLNVPPTLRVAGRTLGARGVGLTLRVLLPAALPNVLTGLRTAWSFAWRALVGGELLIAGARSLGEQLEVGPQHRQCRSGARHHPDHRRDRRPVRRRAARRGRPSEARLWPGGTLMTAVQDRPDPQTAPAHPPAARTPGGLGRSLSLTGVAYRYGGRGQSGPGVGPLDLHVAPGEFVCVVGPSGGGKSTLLSLLAGFLARSAGRFSWAARPCADRIRA